MDYYGISIHALREEGDVLLFQQILLQGYFYPRPPRGGRHNWHGGKTRALHFYPRPPRGGRQNVRRTYLWERNISIHALREEGDPMGGKAPVNGYISIHALREEGDQHRPDAVPVDRRISIHALREEGDSRRTSSRSAFGYFYPRPPRGGRPRSSRNTPTSRPISIHALREEGDASTRTVASPVFYFYPRPPRGGRQAALALSLMS